MPTDRVQAIQRVLGDRYEIQQELGAGGMAVVYLAADRKHGRQVAVKVLRPELALEVGPERFLREIEVTAQLSHPHILPLYDSGGQGSVLYYVMPYVEGESLRARLDRERQLPLEDATGIARDVAAALSHAHSRGVIHRDVKPENILLSGGQAVVADFGIAGVVAGDTGITRTGMVVGTPAYMSPEQAAGNAQVDGRSDLYALACVVYEMLGGEPPHTGPSPQAILARQLSGEVRALRPLRHTVTPAMEKVIQRALAPAAADRYATVSEFADALTRSVGRGSRVRRSSVEWVLRVPLRRRVVLPLAAAAVAAIVALGAWLAFRSGVTAGPARPGIAIFPFRAMSGDAAQWTEQFPDLLTTMLDGTPGIRIADPWALWRPLRAERDAQAQSPADPVEGERLARAAGVDRFVLGAIRENRGLLQLSVRLYAVGREDALESFVFEGTTSGLDSLAQRVAVELIARTAAGDTAEAMPTFSQFTTQSPDALKAYLRAREAIRRGRVDSAEAAIDLALRMDSAFTQGLMEAITIRSIAASMRGEFYTGLMPLAERAAADSARLSERNRLRVKATLASVRTDGVTAAAALAQLLDLDSLDIGAWNTLGFVRLVYGWQFGRGPADALAAFERAVALDPGLMPALASHAQLAVGLYGPEAAGAELARLEAADTANAQSRGVRLALRAVAAPDSLFDTLAAEITARPLAEQASAMRLLRQQRPDRAEVLLERLRPTAAPGRETFQVEGEWARLRIAEGRTREMDERIAAGDFRTFDQFRWVQRLLIGAALTGVGDTAVARRAAAALADYVRPESALEDWNNKPVWWTAWLIAAFHATYGDTSVTARWRATIGTFPPGGTSRDYVGALQADLDARLLARRGMLDSALAMSGRAHERWTIHTENALESQPAPMIRFHSAMLLSATNRPDSAAALLRSLVPPGAWFGPVTARAAYELGRLEAAKGNAAEAARHYQTAIRLWERGGDEVADWLALARNGLAQLVAEPVSRD
jgi:serine/threonine protein kinase/tetratricopeptide (TPR) repeat protein